MKKRNKKHPFTLLIILLLIILCFFVMFLLIGRSDKETSENTETVTQKENESLNSEITASEAEDSSALETIHDTDDQFPPIYTSAGIVIQGVKSYAGKYLEDGSDEIVSNAMALLVKNETEESIQLADMSVTDKDDNTYEFRITTLLPGQEMLILENNRAVYDESVEITSAEITSLALFSEEPDMHEEIFEVQGTDNLITVKNISEETISAARVCYKNISGGIYMGGITYTVSIPELAPGESVELPTRHFTEDASEVVFVTYAR